MKEPRSGRPWSQDPGELEQLIALARHHGVRRYLEIGARHGDTFYALMQALDPGATGVAVDLPGGPWGNPRSESSLRAAAQELRRAGYQVDLVMGDSGAAETIRAVHRHAPFDLALIDGDHRYEQARADWLAYSPMAKIVALHDIAGVGQRSREGHRVDIPQLWAEIQITHTTQEISTVGSVMGIGVVTDGPSLARNSSSFLP